MKAGAGIEEFEVYDILARSGMCSRAYYENLELPDEQKTELICLFNLALAKQRQATDRSEIYFLLNEKVNQLKIGRSTNVYKRIKTLQTACGVSLTLLATIPGHVKEEKNLHRRFAALRVLGEWFNFEAPLREYVGSL